MHFGVVALFLLLLPSRSAWLVVPISVPSGTDCLQNAVGISSALAALCKCFFIDVCSTVEWRHHVNYAYRQSYETLPARCVGKVDTTSSNAIQRLRFCFKAWWCAKQCGLDRLVHVRCVIQGCGPFFQFACTFKLLSLLSGPLPPQS